LPRASPARPPRRPRPPRVELARQVGLGARLEHLPKLGGGHASPSPVLSTVLRCWPTSDGRRRWAQIMDVLLGVVAERGAALVLVTHSRGRGTRRPPPGPFRRVLPRLIRRYGGGGCLRVHDAA
jgi:hypothetical protein